MSERPHSVDVAAWVERAARDPVAYRQRQTVEIVLNAVAMTAPLNTELVLKGGILLGLAYGSPRQTTDIDLTAAFAVDDDVDDRIRTLLDSAFPRAAASPRLSGPHYPHTVDKATSGPHSCESGVSCPQAQDCLRGARHE